MLGENQEILTSRCRLCGCPACDHQPVRYVIRARLRHGFWTLINRMGRA